MNYPTISEYVESRMLAEDNFDQLSSLCQFLKIMDVKNSSVMKYDVFISYSSSDQKIVEGLCAFLEQKKIRCFVAYRDIPKGKPWPPAIVEALETSKIMIIVFSEKFNLSKETDREIVIASNLNIPILVFRLSDSEFKGTKKYYLEDLNWIDAFPNPENEFGNIARSIFNLLKNDTRIEINNINESRGLYPYERDNKWGFKNATGKEVIPCIFDRANMFSEELACVKKGNLWGFIDKTGKEVIPFTYCGAGSFLEGLARVFNIYTEKFGFIDKTGKEVIPCIYDTVFWFSEGLCNVEKCGKWGYIDKAGKVVILCKYKKALPFLDGKALVQTRWRSFYINKKGEKIRNIKM